MYYKGRWWELVAGVQRRRKWYEVSLTVIYQWRFICSNLAGLVPSFEFETRRREMNKEYERELEKENEPVLCGKKKNKKAKKSKKNKNKNKKDDVEEEIVHVSVYYLVSLKEFSFTWQ